MRSFRRIEPNISRRKTSALTLIDLLVVIGVVAISMTRFRPFNRYETKAGLARI